MAMSEKSQFVVGLGILAIGASGGYKLASNSADREIASLEAQIDILRLPGAQGLPEVLEDLKTTAAAVRTDLRLPTELATSRSENEALRGRCDQLAREIGDLEAELTRVNADLATARAQLEAYAIESGTFTLKSDMAHVLGPRDVIIGLRDISVSGLLDLTINNRPVSLPAGGMESIAVDGKVYTLIVDSVNRTIAPRSAQFSFFVRNATTLSRMPSR